MATYLRNTSGLTLTQLADELNTDTQQWGGTTNEISIRRATDELLSVTFGTHEVPATQDGMEQLATFLDVPRAFLNKLPADMQQYVLANLLQRNPANVTVRFTDSGVQEVHKPTQARVEPRQIVTVAMDVLDSTAPVVEWWSDADELRIDVAVPEDFDRGIGGDREVGDITRGGLRFGQNRKMNHAPWVSSYLYRLVCTNGMEVPETGLRVDARKASTVPEVLAELNLAANHAFGQVEDQIRHFYEMRQQRIEGDVSQAVARMAQERHLPARTANELVLRVASELDPEVLGRPASMFDLVNLFTNQANEPGMRDRRGPRRQLESAGGHWVRQEADRCGHCHQVLI